MFQLCCLVSLGYFNNILIQNLLCVLLILYRNVHGQYISIVPEVVKIVVDFCIQNTQEVVISGVTIICTG